MHRDCRKPFSRELSLWGRRYKTDPVIAVCAIYQSIIRRREGICQGPRGTLIGNLQAPPCSIPSVIAKKKTATNLRLVAAPFVVPLTGIYPRAKKPAAGSFFTHCGAPPCSIPSVIAKKKTATNLRLVDAPFVVPLTGIEPVRCCHRGILSPLRLPVPPQRRNDLR